MHFDGAFFAWFALGLRWPCHGAEHGDKCYSDNRVLFHRCLASEGQPRLMRQFSLELASFMMCMFFLALRRAIARDLPIALTSTLLQRKNVKKLPRICELVS